MDFDLSDDQRAIADLAATILADRCPPERLRQLERDRAPMAAEAWAALAAADLLGLALPTSLGGSGLGLLEACLVAEQVGRHVAPVPYWSATAAATTLDRWGSAAQRSRWLPGVIDGSTPVTVALWEPGALGIVPRPAVRAIRDGEGWRLDGVKQPVPWASRAGAMLVPARLAGDVDGGGGRVDAGAGVGVGAATDGSDTAVFVVEPGTPGVTIVDAASFAAEPQHTVTFDAARVRDDALVRSAGEPGHVAAWLRRRCTALLCATALGVAEEALALTARHVSQREQFGVPIGTFQAVAHRCADAYIDTEGIRLTTWQAAWQLDAGLDADDALDVAAYWVADGGQRVVHAAQHLHGGIGVDVDYPLHRYFRWAKVLELLLSGSTGSLLRLGASLATTPRETLDAPDEPRPAPTPQPRAQTPVAP